MDNKIFSVSLSALDYEGPLSVLLDMIKRSEKNIYEVSVSEIVDQFNEYVKKIEIDLEGTGDFIVVASEFHYYKSKMLIPRDYEDTEESEHLHYSLVAQLLEFQKFKMASESLMDMQELDNSIIERKDTKRYKLSKNDKDETDESLWEDVRLYDLVYAFSRVMFTGEEELAVFSNRAMLHIDGAIELIRVKLADKKQFPFTELFFEGITKRELVTFFLAILEMVKEKDIKLLQEKRFRDIYIFPCDENILSGANLDV